MLILNIDFEIMKEFLTLVLVLLGTLWATAQSNPKPLRFIPEAGFVISKPKADGNKEVWSYSLGCQMQWQPETNCSGGGWILVTGLELKSKPFHAEGDVKATPSYIQLPLRIGFKIVIRSLTLDYTFGGYIAERLWGDLNTAQDYRLKHFDAGLGLEVGVNFNKFRLAGYWERGFVSMAKVPVSFHNFDGGIKLGYTF